MTQRTEAVARAADVVATEEEELLPGSTGNWQRRTLPFIFLAVIVGIWELASRFTDVPVYILPAPSAIVERLIRSWPLLWDHSVVTLTEIGIGFALGVLLGLALAIPIAYSTVFRNTVYPLIVASQAVPKIAIAPLLVLWLGFDIMPKIVITALMVFFPVTVTAAEGFTSVDRNLLDLLRSVHASPAQIFFKIRFPHALPQIFSGLKIGITLAVVGAVVGEWVGADSGLGYLLVYANTLLDSTLLFASLILLIAIGVVLFVIVGVLERLLLPWHRDDSTFITA
jgi:NitT/TauT family transport system permease protein